MNTNNEEKELLISFIKGDNDSYYKIYNIFKDRVFSLIYGIVRNREKTEDIFQDVFLKLYKNREKLDSERPLWPYLRKIAINTTYSSFRKGKKELSIDDVPEFSNNTNIEKEYQIKDLMKRILEKLPVNQRLVIVLQKFEGYKLDEISKELGISIKAVESLLSRATKNIVKIYNLIERKNDKKRV
jgi:RNA polymerase sigma-70 factor (ECF subfamily)